MATHWVQIKIFTNSTSDEKMQDNYPERDEI